MFSFVFLSQRRDAKTQSLLSLEVAETWGRELCAPLSLSINLCVSAALRFENMIRWKFLVAGGKDNYHYPLSTIIWFRYYKDTTSKTRCQVFRPLFLNNFSALATHARKAHFSSRWRLSWTTKCIAWNGEADVFSGSLAADGEVWQMADGS